MPIPPKTVAGRERTAHSLQCSDVTKPHYRGGCTAIRSGVLKHQPQDRGPGGIMAWHTGGTSSPTTAAAPHRLGQCPGPGRQATQATHQGQGKPTAPGQQRHQAAPAAHQGHAQGQGKPTAPGKQRKPAMGRCWLALGASRPATPRPPVPATRTAQGNGIASSPPPQDVAPGEPLPRGFPEASLHIRQRHTSHPQASSATRQRKTPARTMRRARASPPHQAGRQAAPRRRAPSPGAVPRPRPAAPATHQGQAQGQPTTAARALRLVLRPGPENTLKPAQDKNKKKNINISY